jgi:HTH-type transcriptional regulator, transcriptional repressor of NAD biosynthesis genes
LFLETDVKWVDDGLRVHGENNLREENHRELKRMLDQNGISYKVINGNYHDRLEQSMMFVNELVFDRCTSLDKTSYPIVTLFANNSFNTN